MFDLHVHSSHSDGTDSPETLVNLATALGLSGFALTDHDTTEGIAHAQARAAPTGTIVIPGIELTSRHRGATVHTLGYFIDGSHPALARELVRIHESRSTRSRQIVNRLAADYPVTWDDVIRRVRDPRTIGRAHIADALVDRGIAHDRPSAFATLLDDGSPYVVDLHAPTVESALAAITASGGVPVIAHVRGAGRSTAGISDQDIETWAAMGLVGLETEHREHTLDNARTLRTLADRLGLITTGGSDYHGTGKPNRLGENLTPAGTVEHLRHLAAAQPATGQR